MGVALAGDTIAAGIMAITATIADKRAKLTQQL